MHVQPKTTPRAPVIYRANPSFPGKVVKVVGLLENAGLAGEIATAGALTVNDNFSVMNVVRQIPHLFERQRAHTLWSGLKADWQVAKGELQQGELGKKEALKDLSLKGLGHLECVVDSGVPLDRVTPYAMQLDDGVYRGSSLSYKMGLVLANAGFKTVVSFVAEGDCDSENFSRIRSETGHNVQTLAIPEFDNHAPSHDDIRKFINIVADPKNRPIYFHCQHGVGRTGVFAAAYRVYVQHWTPAQALEEAKALGLKSPEQMLAISKLGSWSL